MSEKGLCENCIGEGCKYCCGSGQDISLDEEEKQTDKQTDETCQDPNCGHSKGSHRMSGTKPYRITYCKRVRPKCPCKKFKPNELTYKNVIYWSDHWKKFTDGKTADRNTIGIKAQKFVELELIEYQKDEYIAANSCYICKPLPNCPLPLLTHKLKWKKETKDFECSCQYFQTKLLKKEKPYCSHYLALYLMLKIWNWNRKNKPKD